MPIKKCPLSHVLNNYLFKLETRRSKLAQLSNKNIRVKIITNVNILNIMRGGVDVELHE